MSITSTRKAPPTIDADEFRTIPPSQYRPIALGVGSKVPANSRWQINDGTDPQIVVEDCIEQKRNVGLALSHKQCCIDIDTRHEGHIGLKNLIADLNLNPDDWPREDSPSGGQHYFFRKSDGVKITKAIHHPDDDPKHPENNRYRGIDCLSFGQQVLAAGCEHPDGGHYTRDPLSLPREDAPMIPDALLELIRRPERKDDGPVSGGQATPEQIEQALAGLDVEKFNTNDTWFPVLCAVHHASGGEAFGELAAWSMSDPKFAHDRYRIASRWDSLDRNKRGGYTYQTLNYLLVKAGRSDLTIAGNAADDFADDLEEERDPFALEGDDDDDEQSELQKLNAKYCAVFHSGKYRIMYLEKHNGKMRWAATSKRDFVDRYENQRVQNGQSGRGQPQTISLGKGWQEWPNRNTADGTTFDTTAVPGTKTSEDELNLWCGFGVTPKLGDCSKFKAVLLNDLCSGNQEHFTYLIKWLAWKAQNPGLVPETSVVLRGPKGTGKGTLGEAIVHIFGSHGMAADNIEQIAGRFNGHVEAMCIVFADEAFWGGNKQFESKIKKIITDKFMSYEHKGLPSYQGVNRVGVIIAGNESWVVPASVDERRFFVLETSNAHVVPEGAAADHLKRLYWNAVYAELGNGGREAFLFELLNINLGAWHPREGMPATEALGEQKYEGLSGFDKFYVELLVEASIPAVEKEGLVETVELSDKPLHVRPKAFMKAYREWLHFINPRANVSERRVLAMLRPYGWQGGGREHRDGKNRDRFWVCPDLLTVRARVVARLRFNPFEED